jgi:hypothetical protein
MLIPAIYSLNARQRGVKSSASVEQSALNHHITSSTFGHNALNVSCDVLMSYSAFHMLRSTIQTLPLVEIYGPGSGNHLGGSNMRHLKEVNANNDFMS